MNFLILRGSFGERDMVKREVYYFEDFGKHNTKQTIEAAKKGALSLDLKFVVVASASGITGVKTSKVRA